MIGRGIWILGFLSQRNSRNYIFFGSHTLNRRELSSKAGSVGFGFIDLLLNWAKELRIILREKIKSILWRSAWLFFKSYIRGYFIWLWIIFRVFLRYALLETIVCLPFLILDLFSDLIYASIPKLVETWLICFFEAIIIDPWICTAIA